MRNNPGGGIEEYRRKNQRNNPRGAARRNRVRSVRVQQPRRGIRVALVVMLTSLLTEKENKAITDVLLG
jgi:hypothetical protein